MNIGKALTFYTSDEKFVTVLVTFSLLLLSCIFILPILFVGPLMVGYMIDLIKRVQNSDYSLPEIAYSDQWKKGIVLVLVSFLIAVVFMIIQFVLTLPFSFLNYGMSRTSTYNSYPSSAPSTMALVGTLIIQVISLVMSVIQSLIIFAMYAIYARTENVNSLFNFDNYKRLWANNGVNMIIVPILAGLVGAIVVFVGFLALCIGVLPAVIISNFIDAGLIGQLDVKEIS